MRTSVTAILALTLMGSLAHAGVAYDLTLRPLGNSPSPPVTLGYIVQGDTIRIEAPTGTVTLLREGTFYQLDSKAQTAVARPGFTLDNARKALADKAQRFADEAAKAPADTKAQQMADVMKKVAEPPPISRDYSMTDRSETADGRSCRIWEEHEQGFKRLELCVVPAAALPGGADILAGMKAMCQYIYGSGLAFGVLFGPTDVWPSVQSLGGVPVLVREFDKGGAISEITLTAPRPVSPDATLFEVPSGYKLKQ
jgi:hypothetical protein